VESFILVSKVYHKASFVVSFVVVCHSTMLAPPLKVNDPLC